MKRARLALWAALAACGAGEPPPRARNLVLISIDTLRPDHLSCYGYARPTSPTLDGIAARGTRFSDVTAAAPWTLPSHATMLTGLYPSRHGVVRHETRLAEEVVTLAEELGAAGFRTLGVVNTWNLGAPQFGLAQGFEHFEYLPETVQIGRGSQLRTLARGTEILAKARELLASGDPSRPFFLFLHFYDVHTDFTPSEESRRRFVEPYEGRMNGTTRQLVSFREKGHKVRPDDLRWLRQMYDAEIHELDGKLGSFLAWLGERGLRDGTLFAVTSDHGEEFQEHGSLLHGRTQYEEVLRIPLLLEGPGIPAGRVVDTPVHGVDVTPTLLACLGVEGSMPRDGLDLSALFRGETLGSRDLFAEADHGNKTGGQATPDVRHMLRRGSEKLVWDGVAGSTALYDLASDAAEQRDLAAERPARARELLAELRRFRAGAVAGEAIPEPSAEERDLLDALGYGGEDDGEEEGEEEGVHEGAEEREGADE